MSKVNIKRLDSVTSNDTTATALINDNFLAIQEAIENTLSRDGTAPNFMDADLDMNSYRIINSSDPTEDNDIVNLKWVKENIGNASQFAADAAASAAKAATSAQQAAVSATNSLTIYNNVAAAVDGFDQHVVEKTEKFDTNAQEKLDSFNTNAMEKQVQINASVSAAAESANNAEIWAEGTDEQVQAIGGTKSAKGWAEQINDNNIVHKTGDETISGTKTFDDNGRLILEDNAARLITLKSTQYDILNKQPSQYMGLINFRDKNNRQCGWVDCYFVSSDTQTSRLLVQNKNNNVGILGIVIDDDGYSYAEAPTPSALASSLELVNAEWIRKTISSIITPDYSAGITIPQANAFPYTAPSDGVLLIAASSYNNARNEFFINGNSVAIAWSAVSGSATTFYQPVYMKKGEIVTTTRTQEAPANNIFYPMKGTV